MRDSRPYGSQRARSKLAIVRPGPAHKPLNSADHGPRLDLLQRLDPARQRFMVGLGLVGPLLGRAVVLGLPERSLDLLPHLIGTGEAGLGVRLGLGVGGRQASREHGLHAGEAGLCGRIRPGRGRRGRGRGRGHDWGPPSLRADRAADQAPRRPPRASPSAIGARASSRARMAARSRAMACWAWLVWWIASATSSARANHSRAVGAVPGMWSGAAGRRPKASKSRADLKSGVDIGA